MSFWRLSDADVIGGKAGTTSSDPWGEFRARDEMVSSRSAPCEPSKERRETGLVSLREVMVFVVANNAVWPGNRFGELCLRTQALLSNRRLSQIRETSMSRGKPSFTVDSTK